MKRIDIFLLISALAAPLSAFAADRILVQVPAMIDPAASVSSKVRSDCNLDTNVANYALTAMVKRGNGQVEAVASADQAGDDKVVQLTILSVQGAGGGAWSGPKSMTMRADLRQGGATIDSTILTRSTNGGAFAGFTGTCAMLDRVTTTLGKDVATWMERRANK